MATARPAPGRVRAAPAGPGRGVRRPVPPGVEDPGTRPVPRPPVVSTGRVAVVLLVLAGLVFSAVLPVRTYLRQRAQISALEQQVSQETAGVAQLQVAAAQWQDPAFVTAQARSRLGLVAPGETGYVVTDSHPAPAPAGPSAVPGSTVRVVSGAPVAPGPVAGTVPGPGLLAPHRVPVGPVPLPGVPAVRPAVPDVPVVTLTGADGLASLGSASPWWSPSPAPVATTAR